MNLTKIIASVTSLTEWVKDGLTKKADATATATALGQKADATATTTALGNKQSKALVKTTDPVVGDGVDGDICLVVDP